MSDVKSCLDEAHAAVKEVAFAVKSIEASDKLPADSGVAYLNIVTLEGESMCVRIGEEGFRVVSVRPDCSEEPGPACYDTVYSLLSDISEGFRAAFSSALAEKLQALTGSCDVGEV